MREGTVVLVDFKKISAYDANLLLKLMEYQTMGLYCAPQDIYESLKMVYSSQPAFHYRYG